MLARPTQLLIQGQWWSIFSTQRPQTEQWCASTGFTLTQRRHQRPPGGIRTFDGGCSGAPPLGDASSGELTTPPSSALANRSGGAPGGVRTHIQ